MVELTAVAVDEVEEGTDAPRLCERACQFSIGHAGARPSLTTLPPGRTTRYGRGSCGAVSERS